MLNPHQKLGSYMQFPGRRRVAKITKCATEHTHSCPNDKYQKNSRWGVSCSWFSAAPSIFWLRFTRRSFLVQMNIRRRPGRPRHEKHRIHAQAAAVFRRISPEVHKRSRSPSSRVQSRTQFIYPPLAPYLRHLSYQHWLFTK